MYLISPMGLSPSIPLTLICANDKPAEVRGFNDNDKDNDNDNILVDHNVQIETTVFNSLENKIINWSGDYN